MKPKRTYRHTTDGIRYVVGPWYSYGKPSALDLKAIRFLAEQVAIPVDQLGAFLRKSPRQAAALADRLSTHGWVQLALFPGEDHEWMWLRSGGVLRSGMPFGYHHPKASSLEHHRGINDARLRLEAEFPNATWICERSVRLQSRPGDLIPDAALVHADSTWAIEVELTARQKSRTHKKLANLLGSYDRVLFDCSAKTHSFFKSLSEQDESGRIMARLSGVEPAHVRGVRHRGRPAGDYKPTALEANALTLISEEGSVSTERLALLLEADIDPTRNLVEDLFHAEAIRAACGDGIHDGWIWCNYRGARVAGIGLYPVREEPRASRYVKREILTDARIQLRKRYPNGRWVGPRLLQSRHLIPEPFPQAMLENGGRRYSVQVVVGRWNRIRTRDRIAPFVKRLNGVICVCAEDLLPKVRELAEQREWSNVTLEPLERR